jgi:hypothetical protein
VSAAAAKGFFAATRGSGALALEGLMITLKGLMTIGALLVGTIRWRWLKRKVQAVLTVNWCPLALPIIPQR